MVRLENKDALLLNKAPCYTSKKTPHILNL